MARKAGGDTACPKSWSGAPSGPEGQEAQARGSCHGVLHEHDPAGRRQVDRPEPTPIGSLRVERDGSPGAERRVRRPVRQEPAEVAGSGGIVAGLALDDDAAVGLDSEAARPGRAGQADRAAAAEGPVAGPVRPVPDDGDVVAGDPGTCDDDELPGQCHDGLALPREHDRTAVPEPGVA